ncbi:hypothetical protein C8Q79DRAFT_735271 [Trametes meyenii]|nr:hypothetical protein C8Q79DRAFT_735271 [Trametes meyenii]
MIGNAPLTILVLGGLFVGRILANDPSAPTPSTTPGELPDCVVECLKGNIDLDKCFNDTVDVQCICQNTGLLASAFVLLGCLEMSCHHEPDEGLHAIEAACGQSTTSSVALASSPTNTSTTILSTVIAPSSTTPNHTETVTVSQTNPADHSEPTSSITTSSSTLAPTPATASGVTSDSVPKTVPSSNIVVSPSQSSPSRSTTRTSLTNAPSAPPAPMTNPGNAGPKEPSSNAAAKYSSTFWTRELGMQKAAMVIVYVYFLVAAV